MSFSDPYILVGGTGFTNLPVNSIQPKGFHSFWFDAQAPTTSFGFVSGGTIQILDLVYMSSSGGAYHTNYYWPFVVPPTITKPETILRTSSNSAVIVPDPNDIYNWNWVSNGTAVIALSTTTRYLSASVILNTGTATTSAAPVLLYPDHGSLRYLVETTIDAALSAVAVSPTAAQGRMSSYSFGTPTTNPAFNLNPNFWCKNFDTSCWPAFVYSNQYYHSYVTYGYGVLISPLHLYSAQHLYFNSGYNFAVPGDVVWFIGTDNQIYKRSVVSVHAPLSGFQLIDGMIDGNVTPDIMILKLDSPLPNTVTVAKVLPANWRSYLPTDGFPFICGGGWNKTTVQEESKYYFRGARGLSRLEINQNTPTKSIRANQWRLNMPGDSASPMMIYINGTPIVLGSVEVSSVFNPASDYITEINQTMNLLGGGYNLSIMDMTGFPTYS